MAYKRPAQTGVQRVRMPRGKELLGIIDEILGASRFRITGKDGKQRLCRIPGRYRRRIRVKVGDVVIIEPWDIEPDEKADVVWIYNKTHSAWVKKKGFI